MTRTRTETRSASENKDFSKPLNPNFYYSYCIVFYTDIHILPGNQLLHHIFSYILQLLTGSDSWLRYHGATLHDITCAAEKTAGDRLLEQTNSWHQAVPPVSCLSLPKRNATGQKAINKRPSHHMAKHTKKNDLKKPLIILGVGIEFCPVHALP